MPPSAASTSPARPALAPVKAPFSWPNSSDSIRVSGIAAQFTEISGALARFDRLCRARATSSLPVPDSPWISTVESVGATLRILLYSSCIGAQEPMMPISPSAAAGLAPRSPPALPPLAETGAALRFSWRSLRMRATAWSISSWSKGLAM
ncbi:Uncharacterised protein [Acinetobacter baumannii]|nr:Uncharacterised protein [Acinetobacter baumannii]